MGLMPVLPEHVYGKGNFEQTSLATPVGSGPYVVTEAKPTARITYRRDPDYWGRDLPVNRGRFNFDTVTFEYFRDSNALLEAFIKGIIDVRPEDDPTRWFGELETLARGNKAIIREEIPVTTPAGMSAYVLNARRAPFSDPLVRRALILLFDFETTNRLLYSDAYERTQSYFARSALSSHGRPASDQERQLLKPWNDQLDESLLDGTYALPESSGKGANRANRRKAAELLAKAGFRLEGGRRVDAKTGAPLEIEILVASREQERLALSFAHSLKRAGISATTRYVDSAQYQRRLQTFDFDIIEYRWYSSLSPGNEQRIFWGSESAGQEGSRNYAGIANKGVDVMISALLAARDRKEFVAAVRALDRLLLAGHYVIPLFHLPHQWVARRDYIQRPERASQHGYVIDAWWRRAGERAETGQQSDGDGPGGKR
jgi:peptide/nickel transport system substrate-binding protein